MQIDNIIVILNYIICVNIKVYLLKIKKEINKLQLLFCIVWRMVIYNNNIVI